LIRSSYWSSTNSWPDSIRLARFERQLKAIWPRPGQNFQKP
jgi:hypothetical protein